MFLQAEMLFRADTPLRWNRQPAARQMKRPDAPGAVHRIALLVAGALFRMSSSRCTLLVQPGKVVESIEFISLQRSLPQMPFAGNFRCWNSA